MPTKVKDVARHAVTTGEKVVKVSAKVATEEVKSFPNVVLDMAKAGVQELLNEGTQAPKKVAGKIQGRMNRKVGKARTKLDRAKAERDTRKAIVEGQQKILTLRTQKLFGQQEPEPEPEPTTMQKLMGIFKEKPKPKPTKIQQLKSAVVKNLGGK